MSAIDDLLQKRPEERTVVLPLDFELAHAAAQAEDRLNQAKAMSDRPGATVEAISVTEDRQAEYDKAVEALRGQTATFTFRSIAPQTWDELKREHRPSESQRTEARKQGQAPPEWNEETFSPALIAAACIKVITPSGEQPGLSIDEATKLWTSDSWNKSERAELFNAALSAFVARTRMIDLPKAPA